VLRRKPIFPHVLELNFQAGRRIGCNVYVIFDGPEYVLLDIGYDENVPEIVEVLRKLDFPLDGCRFLIASHADVDHAQGIARARQLLPGAKVAAHRLAVEPLQTGDPIITYAQIKAQDVDLPMPPVRVDRPLAEGDVIEVGQLRLAVWHTPGHTPGQIALKMGNLLFSGDNIFIDGSVGVIDAHHGSSIPDFIASLERIRDARDVEWLLPSHGPIFRRDPEMIQRTIDRLKGYQYLMDFGTCAVDWPAMEQWEREIALGILPQEREAQKAETGRRSRRLSQAAKEP
jgi:hydroxyacylglutathione hydrolase